MSFSCLALARGRQLSITRKPGLIAWQAYALLFASRLLTPAI